MTDAEKHRSAAEAAQSGEAELRRYIESHDERDLDRAIELLQEGANHLPGSSPLKIRCMLQLASACAMRFRDKNDQADFRAAIAWNGRVLTADPDDVSKTQALFALGSLQAEIYKRSGGLGLLEDAIDSYTQALEKSGPEHPLRQLLIKALQGMLCELTLKTPDPVKTGDRWHRAISAVPFRSLDQKALQAAWRAAFYDRSLMDNPPPVERSFLETNREGLRPYAAANASAALNSAIAESADALEIASYAELRDTIEKLQTRFPGALLVFRGQTNFHEGLSPSMHRSEAQAADEAHGLWTAALAENLRYGQADPATQMRSALGLPVQDEEFWAQIDLTGPAAEAILQHYGARTSFIDVSTSLDVALWFSHFRFHMRRETVSREELAERGARWDEDDAAPEYDIAWYEPAWGAAAPAWGYLFVIAPRLPQSGEALIHGEYINLAHFPSPRMEAQHAGLVYFDMQRDEPGSRTLAIFKFKLPLAGAPAGAFDPNVERLFPNPRNDSLYARILYIAPFWPDPARPSVQVRRLRIPEYHSAPPARPNKDNWDGDWLPFRALDLYTRPGFVFPRLAKDTSMNRCTFAGREFRLSDALPLVPAVPTMMINVPIPEPGAQLAALGSREVFLEYDPLSQSLSPRAAAHHVTGQIDRRNQEDRSSLVPLPGVRGAWLIQADNLYWCRVYTQPEGGPLSSTAGRAFSFDPRFGWVVKEGPAADTAPEAVAMRAERAALYLLLGIAEQMRAGAWRVMETPGSPYFQLSMAR